MNLNIAVALYLSIQANGHVFVGYPAPFRWNLEIDKLIMPLNGDPNHRGLEWEQQPFPCKGFHTDAPHFEPQTTWYVGSNVTFQIFDSTNTSGVSMHNPGAAHSGGSCQVSFSYDNGATWIVVQSWEGNCLRVRKGYEGQLTNLYDINQDYSFHIPETFPPADMVIVAWTWLNASGNREFYMSCSPVKIKGSNSSNELPTGFPMLIANLKFEDTKWSRCRIPHGVWTRYPVRYRGINQPIVAENPPNGSVIRFIDFEDNIGICGSDNKELVQALALQSRASIGISFNGSCTGTAGHSLEHKTTGTSPPIRPPITTSYHPDPLWAVP